MEVAIRSEAKAPLFVAAMLVGMGCSSWPSGCGAARAWARR